jgi:hypothetical protein
MKPETANRLISWVIFVASAAMLALILSAVISMIWG